MAEQPFLFSSGPWIRIRDGNESGLSIFKRHYSAKRKPGMQAQFVGPGESIVLLTPDARALFVWRKEKFRLDNQTGVNNSVFRNEGSQHGRASDLIRAAVIEAWQRWPGERLFTFVDPEKVRSTNPGYCFLMAGFKRCGATPKGLLIFERLPEPSALSDQNRPASGRSGTKVLKVSQPEPNSTVENPSFPRFGY